jgi:glutathione S-transferase
MIAADIHDHLPHGDQVYFRQTREARLGKTLEAAAAQRDGEVEGFRKTLTPMRLTLKTQPFLGGETPNYADYIVFGPFQWARATSPFRLLKEDDPIYAWREKLLNAFDGMALKSPGYAV